MKGLLRFAFTISRFRFWIYTAGPYVVGYALGMGSWVNFLNPWYGLYLAYFFFPANVFIYGINDYWDKETDRLNPKKEAKEHKVKEDERKTLSILLIIVMGISSCLTLFQDMVQRLIFLAFMLLSYFYSAPPLRFKEVPFLDFSSNVLYMAPGIFGYYLASGSLPPLVFVIISYFHIAAMHLFSAIPDIQCDESAGIKTTAVILRKTRSLILCLFFWSFLSYSVIGLSGFHPLSYLVIIYPSLPLALLLKKELGLERIYWCLPYINTSLGGLLFSTVTLLKV